MPKLDKNLEERLKAKVIRYLKKARPDYDLPHTFSAVEYMKLLIEKEGRNYKDINEKILVTVMYLHDIGYSNLVDANNLDLVLKNKSMHMNVGMAETIKILDKIGGYTKKEIEKIAYLVSIHD